MRNSQSIGQHAVKFCQIIMQSLRITRYMHRLIWVIVFETQCGNERIFLSFRFYVKSILENLESLEPQHLDNWVYFSLLNVQKFIEIKI